MDDELELGYLLAVAAAAVWTPRPLVAMLNAFGSARALIDFAKRGLPATALPYENLGADALGRISNIDEEIARSALAEACQHDHRFVTSTEAGYPKRLFNLCDPPPALYYRGNLEVVQRRVVAVVGSRAATPYGRSVATAFANGFSAYGAIIVSGLARGIDAAAHRAANAAGIPNVAVIGSGLSALYPPYHCSLADEIVKRGGAVISEFPPHMAARQHHFPMRNRLVAALADATVVIEAGTKSGALITARLAAELGRPVFAVPGDLGRTASEGTNALIKDGAALTTGADDMAAVLGWEPHANGLRSASGTLVTDSPLLAALGAGGRDVDEVCRVTGLDAASVSAELTMLEMKGLVQREAGGLYVARPGMEN